MHEAAIFLSIKTHTQEDTNKNLFELSPPMASDTNQFFLGPIDHKNWNYREKQHRKNKYTLCWHTMGYFWIRFEKSIFLLVLFDKKKNEWWSNFNWSNHLLWLSIDLLVFAVITLGKCSIDVNVNWKWMHQTLNVNISIFIFIGIQLFSFNEFLVQSIHYFCWFVRIISMNEFIWIYYLRILESLKRTTA